MIAPILRAAALCLTATILVTGHSHAQGVIVEGGLDCGEWVEARTKSTSGHIEHYLLGLMNGLALGHGVEFWRADGTKISRKAVYLWMDGYCRQNPLSHVVTGAVSLYMERSGWEP